MSEGPRSPAGPGAEPPETADGPPTIPPASRSGPGLRWAVPEPLRHWDAPRRSVGPGRAQPAWPGGDDAEGPGDGEGDADNVTRPVTGMQWLAPEPAPPEPASGRRHRPRWAWALVVLAVLGAAGAGTAVALGRGGAPSGAVAFERLLERSDSAHALVESALKGMCQAKAPDQASRDGDLEKLDRAVALRASVLAALRRDAPSTAGLPERRALVASLKAVTQSSLSADRDYRAWGQDRQELGCYGGPGNDLYYQQAIRAAGVAQGYAGTLSREWASVAGSTGMPADLAGKTT